MAEPGHEDGHEDGYEGPATLVAGPARVDVQVRLRGYFQPIDGRYHWYGRIEPNEDLTGVVGSGRARAVLTTPGGSAPCELSDPDPWQRYRVTGLSTPPFAIQTTPAGQPRDEAAAPEPRNEAAAPEPRGEISGAAQQPQAAAQQPQNEASGAPGPAAPLPSHVRVAIIGAGFGGIGAAIALRKAGHTGFVVLERAAAVGGTWRDNSYPGCTCDVPSHLYSFSFAPNPDWTRSFSRQAEIWDYLERVTDRYGLRGKIRCEAAMTEARWDVSRARWRIRTTRGDLTADVLVSAAGPLSAPALPDIPGLASFPGPVFHSAQWNHDFDLAGKRVAVVGTGASAIQIVPEIQPRVGRLVLFQRTPAWVMPRHDRKISGAEKWLYRHVPLTQRAARLGIYLSRRRPAPPPSTPGPRPRNAGAPASSSGWRPRSGPPAAA